MKALRYGGSVPMFPCSVTKWDPTEHFTHVALVNLAVFIAWVIKYPP